ncbi:MAG: CDP-alcohol phosphatidyltransferase family protein [Candidatus Nanopelagicales bacterium]
MRVQETAVQTDRVLTVPNLLSLFRLLTIPLFCWLALVPRADPAAALVLTLGGLTDYVDGALARRWKQISRLGQLLDPIADRLNTLAVLLVFLVRDIVPWWFVALLVLRDLVLAAYLARLRQRGITGLPVNFLGKAATFSLLVSFPLLLLGTGDSLAALAARAIGWAFAGWGAGLYLYSATRYVSVAHDILAPSEPSPGATGTVAGRA